jgi:galactonate dehydratase
MDRRAFLPYLATPALLNLHPPAAEQAGSGAPMKVTRIDTTYWRAGEELPWKPNWVWVRVYTDSGLVGLGETYPRNEAEASVIHSSLAAMV